MKTRAIFLLLLAFMMRCQAEVLHVYPKIIESREDDGGLVLHIHDNLKLNLEKSSVLAPRFLFRVEGRNGSEELQLDSRELEKDLYHDSRHQSSVVVKQLNGDLEVRGILNHELRIEPLPTSKRSDDGTTLHKVFKVKERMNDPLQYRQWLPDSIRRYWPYWQRPQTRPPRPTQPTWQTRTTRQSRPRPRPTQGQPSQADSAFTVELCIVTSSGYRKAFETTQALLIYVIIMLNAVNLRYADMTAPRVHFQLNSVTASQDNRMMARKSYGLDITDTLKNMKEYIKSSDYDICDNTFLVSEEDFVTVSGNKVEETVTGLAYVGSTCGTDRVAVGEDKPHSYDGVYTMAHELCHSLGSTHDGNKPINYIPEHPGAERCPWSQGFLMSYEDGGLKKYTLSRCSMEQVRVFFRTLSSTCIEVRIQTRHTSIYYPGQTMTDEKFCNIMHPKNTGVMAYNRNEQAYANCKIECCWVTSEDSRGRRYLCAKYSMPEAMTCDKEKTCRRGVCAVHNWRKPNENNQG